MNNIAVIFRGQMRTWNYLCKRNIKIIRESIQHKIDWYFCYPETETISEKQILSLFDQDETVHIKVVKDENYNLYGDPSLGAAWKKYGEAYYRQAYFEYHAGLIKRRHEVETGIRYTNVVALRPDCMLYGFPNFRNLPLSGELSGFMRDEESAGDLVGADFHYIAGDKASNLMLMRYLDTAFTDGLLQAVHAGDLQYPQYYIRNNLIMQNDRKAFFMYRHIRPIHLPFINDSSFDENIDDYLKLLEVWRLKEKTDLITICQDYGIDIRDYSLKL